ncbi:phosphotransferase family protein [Paenibacillus eucommiae]|uniref:Aminoglycoside phosphotransferase (APT) family kinase protein n=1 Tax=Paenibacillus eucommiae TaxID=1355755 RepID=A0ABS4IZN4_9BACL|nr:aminoglycoside phosphotransferase family protein [Paenibacillus eucommiae]MBP1993053.1 aminoglycoside phosphotransferase (APT) family kinase protein [Paenibacillus eucommiae]
MIKNDAPNIELVLQLVRDCLNSKSFKLERVFSGVSTYVYRIQFGEDILYLRILPEQGLSFGVEVYVHSLLRQKEVQVPEVIHFEHFNETIGMSMMLVKEICGSNVKDCSSVDEYEGVLFEAGKQLAIINQVKVDGFGWIKRGEEEYGTTLRGEKNSLYDYIYEFLDEDLALLSKQVFSKSDISQITSFFSSGIELMLRHKASLIHGDFDDSHIFQQAGKYTGIIDFGEIQGNSPLYDLGHFKIHDGQYQRYYGYNSLARGYDEARHLSSNDRLEIDLWALWIGIRRLGAVCKRTWGSYHEHLIKAIKIEMDLLSKKL